MASAFKADPNRVYTHQIGDRVEREIRVWDESTKSYVEKLFVGAVSAIYCGIGKYGPYHELYEVTFDEPVYPEIYGGDGHVSQGYFDYGLRKVI